MTRRSGGYYGTAGVARSTHGSRLLGSRDLNGERRTAAAGGLSIGVLDGEPATLQIVDEIDFGTREVADTDRIDEKLDPVRFEHTIRIPVALALFDHKPVLKTRASAALHENTKPRLLLILLAKERIDLRCCSVCDVDDATHMYAVSLIGDHYSRPARSPASPPGVTGPVELDPGTLVSHWTDASYFEPPTESAFSQYAIVANHVR